MLISLKLAPIAFAYRGVIMVIYESMLSNKAWDMREEFLLVFWAVVVSPPRWDTVFFHMC